MSAKKLQENGDNLHGEENTKPRFGINENPEGVYDDQKPVFGNGSGPAADPSESSKDQFLSGSEIAQKEKTADSKSDENTASVEAEKETLGIGSPSSGKNGFGYREEKPGRFSLARFRGRFTRRRVAGVVAAGVVGVGGIGIFSVVQGPLQFIHFAQNLQKFHFRSNEDFGDDRSSKVLLYAVGGLGAERGRLGITANKFADKWEQKIVDRTGLRPVYNKTTGRFAGWEIVDQDKARPFVEQWEKDGGKTTKVSEAGGQGVKSTQSKNGQINNDSFFLDARDENARAKRNIINSVSKSTSTSKVAGVLGARLLKKRGGVDFAPLKNKKRDIADNLAAKRAQKREIREASAESDRTGSEGFKQGRVGSAGTDANGNDVIDPNAAAVASEGAELSEKAQEELSKLPENGESIKNVRLALVRGAGGAALVGVLCGVQSFGSEIETYKHQNIAMPVMRMGFKVISMGNQVMSGQDVNPLELEAFNDTLYDEETGTSWTSARSIQAELGKEPTGPDIPEEAKLSNVNDKPEFFKTLDNIPGLSTACSVQDAIFGLPVIKQVTGLIDDITSGVINTALGAAGTNTEELMGQALSVASGNSVNLYAEGADKGNLANLGAFMAGNDAAIAMGGDSLTRPQAAELKEIENLYNNYDNSSKSYYARYLDPYDSSTLAAQAIDSVPASKSQFAAVLGNPIKFFGNLLSSISSSLVPKTSAQAAIGAYDYGVPKYGFTLGERNNTAYEDPYENARYIEGPDPVNGGTRLENLNERYGECFSMTIRVDEEGVHLESGESVNVFEQQQDEDCNKTEGDPEYDEYLRYRFYIADSVTAITLACNEGDVNACAELGTGSGTDAGSINTTSSAAGTTIDTAALGKNSETISCAAGSNDLGVVTSRYIGEVKSQPEPLRIRLCQIPEIPGSGNNTSGSQISGGAVVNSIVSGAFVALAKQAKIDGINLGSSSSFRLADSCGGTGDGSACARPGNSPHQLGVAIDFTDMGDFVRRGSTTSCSGRMTWNSAAWKWMHDNAENFGFKQYSGESWHWDPIPMSNRCGSNDG